MGVVVLTKEVKISYSIFSYLREKLSDSDICKLRHISVYIARTNDEFDVDSDLQLNLFGGVCELKLSNGSVIRFGINSYESLTFIVENEEENVYMTLYVSKHEPYNLSTAFVHGTVGFDEWKYEVGSDDYESDICFIKVYYKDKLMEESTSYFKASTDTDIGLDCIDGLGHLTSIMTRVDLLYNNLRRVKNNKLVRKR